MTKLFVEFIGGPACGQAFEVHLATGMTRLCYDHEGEPHYYQVGITDNGLLRARHCVGEAVSNG